MQCKCSLNNNYQVIGLCDIEKFNEKINNVTDKSWTQIIIPEKLILPINYPNLESISKVYLDIKIASTKIINTPNSDQSNIQGLLLTGKMLLVSGTLCQNIIYISDAHSQSIHSIKFNIDFNTHIVIDKNTDIDIDKFCVYPCVEDVSVRTLNKRTISKNVTLFLFAHKIISPVPPPIPINIPNKFIFLSTFNENMSEISFNSNKKLIITSTTAPYNVPGSTQEAFRFQLLNSDGQTFKTSVSIKQNEDATKFRTDLNEESFEIDDLIFLKFADKSKVVLTDYPNTGDTYQMIGKSGDSDGQGFKITSNGIVPYILPNDIILNDQSDAPIVTVQFDILSQKILAKATGKTAPAGGTNYFVMTLYDTNGTTIRNFARIDAGTSGTNFANTFNGIPFQWNYFVELNYQDSTKVVVTNFLPLPQRNKRFRITQNGLTDA